MLCTWQCATDRFQCNPGKRFTPVVGVVPEVELLHGNQQATKFAQAELFTLRLAEHPVVLQDLSHHACARCNEVLLVASLGVEAGNGILNAGEVNTLRAQLLAERVVRQAFRLITEHAINHVRQGFTAKHLAGLGDQRLIDRDRRERPVEKASKMAIQGILYCGIAGIAQRPVHGQPFAEIGSIPSGRQMQHQIGAQSAQQPFAVIHVGANLGFQLTGHAGQQMGFQVVSVRAHQGGFDQRPLIQPATL